MKESRRRKFEVDRTPVAVARQGLRALADIYTSNVFVGRRTLRALDVCAGSGTYASCRDFLPSYGGVEWTCLEIRPEERKWLFRVADRVVIGDVAKSRPAWHRRFDLVVGNPAFSLVPVVLRQALKWVKDDGIVCLLGLNELGTRGSSSRMLWSDALPTHQLRVAGTVSFRGPGINPETGKRWGTDQRSYSHWVWGEQHREVPEPYWVTMDLPLLASDERKWKTIPGR